MKAAAIVLLLGSSLSLAHPQSGVRSAAHAPAFHGIRLDAPRTYDAGSVVEALVAGNLNGDGSTDILVVKTGVGPRVLTGTLSGELELGFDFPPDPLLTGPNGAALGDFDLDGRTDVALTYHGFPYDQFAVALWFGVGDGTFLAGPTFEIEAVPSTRVAAGIRVADVDNNFAPDIVLLGATRFSFAKPELHVLLNDGSGAFTLLPAQDPGGFTGRGLEVGDWNEDGLPDVFLSSSNTPQLLLGNGDGTFATPQPLGATGLDPLAADVDADGHLDVVASSGDTTRVFLGAGDGTFATAIESTTALGVSCVLDLDGDGLIDLARLRSTRLTTYRGDGSGAFAPLQTLVTALDSDSLVAADVDRRGGADLVVGSTWSRSLAHFASDPSAPGELIGASPSPILGPIVAATTADVDEDGLLDIVGTQEDALVQGAAVHEGDGSGGFVTTTALAGGNVPVSVASGDWNDDGHADVLIGSSDEALVLWHGDGTGAFTFAATLSSDWPSHVAAGDFDEDGSTDMLVCEYIDDLLRLRRGSAAFAPGPALAVGAFPAHVISADWNADGHLDAGLATFVPAQLEIWLGDGSGGFAASATVPTGIRPRQLLAVDLDGDGVLDIASAYEGGGTSGLVTALGNGDGTFGPASTMLTGRDHASSLAALDLDADGRLDLAVAHGAPFSLGSGQRTGDVTVFRGHGDGSFAAPIAFGLGSGAVALFAADFDGDGRTDLAAVNESPAEVVFVRNLHRTTPSGHLSAPRQLR